MAVDAVIRFVDALAAARWDHVRATLDLQVAFRGMTPGRCWEAGSADAVVTDVLQQWFDEGDEIIALVRCAVEQVADRYRLGYRLLVRNADGVHVVDQQGYCDVDDAGRITRLHLMCAGFRPDPTAASR